MNNILETPQIAKHTQTHSHYSGTGAISQLTNKTFMYNQNDMNALNEVLRGDLHQAPVTLKKGKIKMTSKRLVQVFIADPDPKMPLKDSLIYKGDVKLTDSDDEELFFDLPIKELLASHNEKREKTLDKKAKGAKCLEPIRIRELKMTVVTLAEF